MNTSPLSRRTFLQTAAAATLTAGLARAADEKPRIGLVGCGGMGVGDAKNASRFGTVVAVCDVDAARAAKAAGQFQGAKVYEDFRKLVERKDIDVVINGTPDHWHTLVNLAALKAGKDVYSEKPLTLTIDEGKRLVKAVKETGRVLQTGSQQRSDRRFRQAVQVVRAGRLGELTQVTTILPAGPVEGPFRPQPVPEGLDWDAWQGQTPEHDYTEKRCHLWFRYWLDYSGGTLTDWGAHHNDIALWAMGLKGPSTIEAKVLKKPIPGGYTAPGEYEVVYGYSASPVRHVCRTTTVNNIFGSKGRDPKAGELGHGIKFEGKDGWLFVTRGKIEASKPEILKDPVTDKEAQVYVSDDHMGNFFECVKTRKPPICDAEVGHRSASLCHLGGIALRLGRRLKWDPAKEEFISDKEANRHVAREQRKPWTYDAV
jgi:predicted dehydrogenase